MLLTPLAAANPIATMPLVGAAVLLAGAVVWIIALQRRLRQQHKRLAELEASESRFRMLFERSPDATTLFDTNSGTFVDCNEAALRLTNSTKEWWIGKYPWQLAPERQPGGALSRDKAGEIVGGINQTGSARFEWQHSRADGTDFPAEISVTILDASKGPLWSAVIRDVTAWKQAQAEVQQANTRLEQRVAERTAELARANEQLREAEQTLRRALEAERELSELKSNFVSMVSHEFRTPLGIINMSSQILDRYFARLDEAQRRQHIEAISKAVHRMASMMENVLVLSRADRSHMDFKPVSIELEPFCRRLIDEMHSATSAASPIQFTCDPDVPETATADENLLRHILSNLLSNAVKYSPLDRPARLTLRRDGEHAVFLVEDEGIGIPEADRASLFQTFHRGSNVGQVPGTGLGLVIVKRCCDLHRGEISFESIADRGTVFTVRVPAFTASPATV